MTRPPTMNQPLTPEHIMQVGLGFWASKTLLSAVETGLSHPANVAIAQRFPWGNHKSFVDVGTAQGDLAVQVAKAHPHLTGIGFDLAAIGPIFDEHVARQALSARVRFEPGDFFYRPL